MITDAQIERLLIDWYRLANPRSRALRLIVIHRNGTSMRNYRNVVTGAVGGSYGAKFRRTKQSYAWEQNEIAALITHVRRVQGWPSCGHTDCAEHVTLAAACLGE
jgi:hypothetical protein